jgi:hypothetical protein
METLLKNKKTYLMVAGTFLPAFLLQKGGAALGLDNSKQQILFIAGLIAGGMVTAKMLK